MDNNVQFEKQELNNTNQKPIVKEKQSKFNIIITILLVVISLGIGALGGNYFIDFEKKAVEGTSDTNSDNKENQKNTDSSLKNIMVNYPKDSTIKELTIADLGMADLSDSDFKDKDVMIGDFIFTASCSVYCNEESIYVTPDGEARSSTCEGRKNTCKEVGLVLNNGGVGNKVYFDIFDSEDYSSKVYITKKYIVNISEYFDISIIGESLGLRYKQEQIIRNLSSTILGEDIDVEPRIVNNVLHFVTRNGLQNNEKSLIYYNIDLNEEYIYPKVIFNGIY